MHQDTRDLITQAIMLGIMSVVMAWAAGFFDNKSAAVEIAIACLVFSSVFVVVDGRKSKLLCKLIEQRDPKLYETLGKPNANTLFDAIAGKKLTWSANLRLGEYIQRKEYDKLLDNELRRAFERRIKGMYLGLGLTFLAVMLYIGARATFILA